MKKYFVSYYDAMEDRDSNGEYTLRTKELDLLFWDALSMNNMGFSDGYETEYVVRLLVTTSESILDMIDIRYKLDLISSWDYNIVSVKDEGGNLIQDLVADVVDDDCKSVDIESICNFIKNNASTLSVSVHLILVGLIKHPEMFKALNGETKKILNQIIA